MEKGHNPELPQQISSLYQSLREGQKGMRSFEEVRQTYRNWAISVLSNSEKGREILEFNQRITFPEE